MNRSRITFTLNELVYVLNSTADRLLRANFTLTYSQFLFLVTLMSQDKPTPSYLAECLGVSRAAVSQRLSWFQERNLVKVSRVSGNEKNLSLELTRKGELLTTQSADWVVNSSPLRVSSKERFFSFPDTLETFTRFRS